jgi:hypothetical protein
MEIYIIMAQEDEYGKAGPMAHRFFIAGRREGFPTRTPAGSAAVAGGEA